jgi:hypothetical protein
MLTMITTTEAVSLVQNFNWHTPSWDLFIVLAWVGASIVYSFATGRGRVINILLSVFMAKLLTIEAPFLTNAIYSKVPSSLQSLQQLAAFVAIFLVLFMLLGRFVFKTSADSHRLGSLFFSLIFSFLQIGLLINIILTFLPLGVQENFSQLIQFIFIKKPAGFIWLVTPIVYLVLLGKFVGDTAET